VQKPLEYLKAMLNARFNFQDSSQSSSTTSGATSEAPSLGNILTKIKTKILDVDLFKVLGENALAHIELKKILKQVNVLETSAEVGSFVMELMTLIDLATADLHRQRDLSQQISTKSETQVAEWDAVATSTDKVSKLQQLSETYIKEVAVCDDNIQKWEKQIASLQEKISQEKKRKASIQQPKQNEIDDELKVGIRHAERAQQLSQEIETLSTHKSLCDHRLQFQRKKFATLKETFASINL
jgi:chromosome segregation ATPase